MHSRTHTQQDTVRSVQLALVQEQRAPARALIRKRGQYDVSLQGENKERRKGNTGEI
jgi:hypothetical protein